METITFVQFASSVHTVAAELLLAAFIGKEMDKDTEYVVNLRLDLTHLRPGQNQMIFYHVLISETVELKEDALSFSHDCNLWCENKAEAVLFKADMMFSLCVFCQCAAPSVCPAAHPPSFLPARHRRRQLQQLQSVQQPSLAILTTSCTPDGRKLQRSLSRYSLSLD